MSASNKKRVEQTESVSWLQMLGSSVAAAFGVQSSKNRERDFEHGDVRKFALAGLLVTSLLLFGLVGLVQLVLA